MTAPGDDLKAAIDAFIAEARAVTVAEAAERLGLLQSGRRTVARPCPVCGGRDRFAIDAVQNVWNCRGEGKGGHDAISLYAHVNGHDVTRRAGFIAACSDALNRAAPGEGAMESESERHAREQRMAERRADSEKRAAAAERKAQDFRAREIEQARGIYFNAFRDAKARPEMDAIVSAYLAARTGEAPPAGLFSNICGGLVTYWHGFDEMGRKAAIYRGPAMVAPFVDLSARVLGCHITWIDMGNKDGKFRPSLWGLTDAGREAGRTMWCEDYPAPSDAAIGHGFYEKLVTKKMRGQKKAGLIPVHGDMKATRWVVGEGIENIVFIAHCDGWRDDTFYVAAGDIGNIAGPADRDSAFNHPTLTLTDKRGRVRPVRIAGPVPKPGAGEEAYPAPDHVTDIIHIVDGDSEPVFTAAAMARAEARLSRPGRTITDWTPPEGMDWTDLARAVE